MEGEKFSVNVKPPSSWFTALSLSVTIEQEATKSPNVPATPE